MISALVFISIIPLDRVVGSPRLNLEIMQEWMDCRILQMTGSGKIALRSSGRFSLRLPYLESVGLLKIHMEALG